MKNKTLTQAILLLGIEFMILPFILKAQESALPPVSLFNLQGKMLNARDIRNDNQPLMMVFWKMSDRKSCENLESLYQVFTDSTMSNTAKMIAICEDEGGAFHFIESFVASRSIDIEVYIDKNGDFRRAMGVTVPHTILFDSQMSIHCRQQGYCAGNDGIVCNEIRKCLAKVK